MSNDDFKAIEPDMDSDRFCAVCGTILPTTHIAASFDVTEYNWTSKQIGAFYCDLCQFCYNKIIGNVNGGIELAYERISRERVNKDK